jgi:hypothetical protein
VPPYQAWGIDVYETGKGQKPASAFMRRLGGRNRAEAVALVKLLEERGNGLRRPHSGALGQGLCELRGKEVRIFHVFLPERVIGLLDGEIKKRDDIPAKTLERVRGYQREAARRGLARRPKGRSR